MSTKTPTDGTEQSGMPIHPYCLAFPEASKDDYDSLKLSIQASGQLDAIVVLGGEILDGRTRYGVTRELKIPPQFRQYDPVKDGPDPLAWVIAKNLHRRHLTVGQRAALAVSLEHLISERKAEAKKAEQPAEKPTPNGPAPAAADDTNAGGGVTILDDDDDIPIGNRPAPIPAADSPKPDNRTRTEASKIAGVSTGSTAKAMELEKHSPDLFAKVKSGEMTLDAAHKEWSKEKADRESSLPGINVQRIDSYRAQSADMLAGTHGDKFADAVRASTILKENELREFMKIAVADQVQIRDLVSTGWKTRQAVKFVKGIFEQDDHLREVLNLANMRGGKAVVKLNGFTMLVLHDDQLVEQPAHVTVMIAEILKSQARPETDRKDAIANTGELAFGAAKPLKENAGAKKSKSSTPPGTDPPDGSPQSGTPAATTGDSGPAPAPDAGSTASAPTTRPAKKAAKKAAKKPSK